MQIYNDLLSVRKDKNTVLTIGTFDGVHLGHQKIIKKVRQKASGYGARSLLITFNPHPRKVLAPGKVKILTTITEKKDILEKFGIENLFIIDFTKEFSQQPAEKFFTDYIINGTGLREIVIGYDHHFGKGRSGDIETLHKLGAANNFSVEKVEEFKLDSTSVSSSEIRKALNEGNIYMANSLLGRYYSFSGTVIHGNKRGKSLGFPTANIMLDDEDKMLPALGIYVVEFFTGGNKYYGLLSIGRRPTFYNDGVIVPEVYIYDFDDDIYNENVTVNVIDRLRGEEKFPSAEALISQMNKDKEEGLQVLNRLSR